MRSLCLGLRSMGRSVWLHKPVACGYWAEGMAEDARDLVPFIADGQDPRSCCQHQWPEAASPHLACAAAGDHLAGSQLQQEAQALLDQSPQHCLIEGAGGVCVPLSSDDYTVLDLACDLKLPVLLVTRPHLGTLNHSQLSVQAHQSSRPTLPGDGDQSSRTGRRLPSHSYCSCRAYTTVPATSTCGIALWGS